MCEILNDGLLRERKGVNVPAAALKLPSVTEKDKADLRFALDQGVDYIALSFVRRAQDVELLKDLIASAKADTHVIAKLEKPQALDDLARILEVADGVMVARGDLGVELSPWQVPGRAEAHHPRSSRHAKAGDHRHPDARIDDRTAITHTGRIKRCGQRGSRRLRRPDAFR